MKQLQMTSELQALIQLAVGTDVSVEGFAVFEAIAVNSNPLPGKKGSIFEGATVAPVTLKQMADSISAGNHIPLISDHQMMGEPKGRMFAAALDYAKDGALELRALFYLDPTETTLIAKLNAGSLDEVSVSFLSSELLCSECGWDYMGPEATFDNIVLRTCGNDHTVGTEGVHTQLVGLNQFIELSLVARGAADNPKIVGRSQSKLTPASTMRLAARGFEFERLICQATAGEEIVTFDPTKLMDDLIASKTLSATLTIEKTGFETQLTAVNAELVTLNAQVADLTTQLAAAKEVPSNEADYQVAVAFLGETLTKVLVASNKEVPATMPASVAELKAAILEHTTNLTAILPVGGVSAGLAADTSTKPAFVASAYTTKRSK